MLIELLPVHLIYVIRFFDSLDEILPVQMDPALLNQNNKISKIQICFTRFFSAAARRGTIAGVSSTSSCVPSSFKIIAI